MKYLVLLFYTAFLFSCASTNQSAIIIFDEFKIQKLTEAGVKVVSVGPSENEWPQLTPSDGAALTVNSQKIVFAVLGDTGCRLKEGKKSGSYQDCGNPKEWPYPLITKSLQNETYDLLVHTGDYHYREHCTRYDKCPTHVGYGWATWYDDFYNPTKQLFDRTPFLFVRGNHEDCKRAHEGWTPLSSTLNQFSEGCLQQEPTQFVEIGDLLLVNFDNSDFDDKKDLKPTDKEDWLRKLADLKNKIKSYGPKKEVWFLSHKPLISYFPNDETAEPEAMKENLYELAKEAGLIDSIDFALSGHAHNQQVVLKDPKFVQIVVGNGGTSLEPFGRRIQTEQLITSTVSDKSFGYAIFSRETFKKWTLEFKDVSGKTELTCQLKKENTKCSFPLN